MGSVDVLVNNAGVALGAPLLETDDVSIERTFQVNALAHFWVSFASGVASVLSVAVAVSAQIAPRCLDSVPMRRVVPVSSSYYLYITCRGGARRCSRRSCRR